MTPKLLVHLASRSHHTERWDPSAAEISMTRRGHSKRTTVASPSVVPQIVIERPMKDALTIELAPLYMLQGRPRDMHLFLEHG